MGKEKYLIFAAATFAASCLFGQTTSYQVLKKQLTPGSDPTKNSFQWIATNRAVHQGKFLVIDEIPSGLEVDSILPVENYGPSVSINPGLPAFGPATIMVGPFDVPLNSSVTFQVDEVITTTFSGQGLKGDTFALLPLDKFPNGSSALSGSGNSSENLTGTGDGRDSEKGLVQFIYAAPNISRNNQPVHFLVGLNRPAQIQISLFTITGEKIFDTSVSSSGGPTSMEWDTRNLKSFAVASGLYVYLVQVTDGKNNFTSLGKVLVLR